MRTEHTEVHVTTTESQILYMYGPCQKSSAWEDRGYQNFFLNFLRPELPCDHREGSIGCGNYEHGVFVVILCNTL